MHLLDQAGGTPWSAYLDACLAATSDALLLLANAAASARTPELAETWAAVGEAMVEAARLRPALPDVSILSKALLALARRGDRALSNRAPQTSAK